MSKRLPDLIEPSQAARNGQQYRLAIAQSRFPRLMEMLQDDGAREVDVALDFFEEPETGYPAFTLTLKTPLSLQCQRTLEAYDEPVDETYTAVVVNDEAEAKLVPEQYDTWLLEAPKLNPWQMIEDELLLAIPQVPRKPGEPLVWLDGDAAAEAEENPFAALKDLMKKH
ncbi:uncharacterized protein SAMN05443662_0679 [Sulfurivirga caldicuralii]|uniref:Large ribosomal RNA subunit accumulation protein YceD n=1 Tax=Sulfurivirga caldicuralii TaxID=364032 RepID=A0A1N6EMJ9_9GAMM|nr:YceD family protein [Sulfurivirga caldicuralii]SIN84187.1 uncharacterized protein SAMN05443662_0679 [Sulfurivirga caldicuralii]